MTLYRVALSLTSPLETPLASPTLFGLVCQVFLELDGEQALNRWIEDPEGIWRISDGFPAGYLPKPLVAPRPLPAEKLDTVKVRKRRPWIRRDTWIKNRKNWSELALADEDFLPDCAKWERRAHNVVDRHGRGTLETAGLFFFDEDWRFALSGEKVDLYVESDSSPDRIFKLLNAIGQRGYGRNAAIGRGRFDVSGIDPDPELESFPGASRRMSLSRGVLTPETMLDAYWRVEPHFGRVGPELSLLGVSPFKKPVLLTRPGASFRPAETGMPGRWITGVHPERPEIGLNGLHLAIPFSEADR